MLNEELYEYFKIKYYENDKWLEVDFVKLCNDNESFINKFQSCNSEWENIE